MTETMKIATAAALAALACWGGNSVGAAEVYSLDPVTVTATRYEKKDLEVPASTQVIMAEQLARTGANNLQKALAFTDGTVYAGMGPNGTGLTSMTSKIVVRGMEDGTLVLVNGTPVNWRGKYNLEDFPVDNIERVEIVRGGGSVLYGSQATGGVINIITKKDAPNEVHAGFGNYGQQDHGITVNADKLTVAYNYNKWDDVGYVSSYTSKGKEMKNRFDGLEKNDFLLTYKFNDKVDFLYNHDDSWNNWAYSFGKGYPAAIYNAVRYTRLYSRGHDFGQFNFKDGHGLTGHAFYLRDTMGTKGQAYRDSTGTKLDTSTADGKDTITTYGYDLQKVWQGDLQTFLLGTSYTKEKFQTADYIENTDDKFGRNVFSFFGQWDRNLTDKDKLIVSGRETWTTGAAENKNYDNFSGQAQFLHEINDEQTWYISAGQSFVMPSFSNMYSTGVSNRIIGDPDLKPLRGLHYEAGWKMDDGHVQYRVAAFASRTKDDISFSKVSGKNHNPDVWYVMNQDTKNRGIEASVTVQEDNGFSWHYGVTYNNPQAKVNSDKSTAKTYWDRMYGRWQMNGGVSYQKDKWSASLNGTYLFDRVMTPTSTHSFATKPYFLTSLNVQYAPDKNSTITLSIDNLLDRNDNVSHTSSYYYATPTNYLLSYRYKF